jgi:uncharacterized protein (TIGR03083 family)
MFAPNPSGIIADNSAAGLRDQLDEVWTSLAFVGAALAEEEWLFATACPGWNVAAQYAHVIGTESMLLGRPSPEIDPGRPEHVRNDIGGFNEVWVATLAGQPRETVLAQFDEVTEARRAALDAMSEDDFSAPAWTPIGQSDYRRFMQIRVFDCWVHEQDVRDAVRRPGHEDGPVAEQAIDEIARALGYLVGKKAGAPDGSAVTLELTGPVERSFHVAMEGRAKLVASLDGPATATVTLASSTFTRLACGRVDPGAVLDRPPGAADGSGRGGAGAGGSGQAGAAEGAGKGLLSGDIDLARRVVANLAFTI